MFSASAWIHRQRIQEHAKNLATKSHGMLSVEKQSLPCHKFMKAKFDPLHERDRNKTNHTIHPFCFSHAKEADRNLPPSLPFPAGEVCMKAETTEKSVTIPFLSIWRFHWNLRHHFLLWIRCRDCDALTRNEWYRKHDSQRPSWELQYKARAAGNYRNFRKRKMRIDLACCFLPRGRSLDPPSRSPFWRGEVLGKNRQHTKAQRFAMIVTSVLRSSRSFHLRKYRDFTSISPPARDRLCDENIGNTTRPSPSYQKPIIVSSALKEHSARVILPCGKQNIRRISTNT